MHLICSTFFSLEFYYVSYWRSWINKKPDCSECVHSTDPWIWLEIDDLFGSFLYFTQLEPAGWSNHLRSESPNKICLWLLHWCGFTSKRFNQWVNRSNGTSKLWWWETHLLWYMEHLFCYFDDPWLVVCLCWKNHGHRSTLGSLN